MGGSRYVVPPHQDRAHAGIRAVAEALAQGLPVTSGLVRFFQHTDPPRFERDLAAWRVDASAKLNDHEDRLDGHAAAIEALVALLRPQLVVGDLAVAVGLKLVEADRDGLPTPYTYNAVRVWFPDTGEPELREALHELQDLDLVTVSAASDNPVSRIRPGYALFKTFDSVVHGFDTRADARALAGMLLEDERRRAVRELHAASGWPKRRFNPAVGCLLRFFDDGHVSKTIQPDYPTSSVIVGEQERRRLRRFVAEGEEGAIERRAGVG